MSDLFAGDILLLTLAVVVLGLLIIRMRGQFRLLQETAASQSVQLQSTQRALISLQRQLRTLTLESQDLTGQLEGIASRQQELEGRDMGNMTYVHASKMVKMGAGQEDLINNCGLSPAEAHLFELMHRRNKAVKPSLRAAV